MADAARKLFTAEVLDTLPTDVRAEVIEGELVYETMTGFEHGDAQGSIAGELKNRFRGGGPDGKNGWWIATEVDVIYSPTNAYRHDLAGWRKSRVPKRPTEKRVTVRPDWVCEILSTNKRKDLVEKRHVLHQSGVPHYWIVDLEARVLTVLRHHADGYLLVATVSPGETERLEPFELALLDVSLLFGDLEGE